MENGKKEGKGVYTTTNGMRYDGNWSNDQYNGKGIFIWNDGARYDGEFKSNKFHGNGLFDWNKNGIKYNLDRYKIKLNEVDDEIEAKSFNNNHDKIEIIDISEGIKDFFNKFEKQNEENKGSIFSTILKINFDKL